MNGLITTAARALAAGDPLAALNLVALRDEAPSLALRGIAMAQLGELNRAKVLVRSAARAFGPRQPLAHARCIVAEAEIALAARDLGWPTRELEAARATLEEHDDWMNAAHARCIEVRRLLLVGRLHEAEQHLKTLDPASLPPALKAVHGLIMAYIAMHRVESRKAHKALEQAERAAREACIPALVAEVESAVDLQKLPAARLIVTGTQRPLWLDDVQNLLNSEAFVVDACRYVVQHEGSVISLATRPILFTLLCVLGESWPDDVSRDALVARAFRVKRADESHRARLRVEIGRLRRLLKALASVNATPRGFALAPYSACEVLVLARPAEEKYGAVLALLYDGQPWSSSALALALDTGQRSVQRALHALAEEGKVHSLGRGRTRRWTTSSMPGFATTLLLPASLPVD